MNPRIEKTGHFAEHAEAISDYIPRKTLMYLPDEYIYQHIMTNRESPQSSHGRDTYYGQKFFYRTAQGPLLTFSIPKLVEKGIKDIYHPKHYPELPDILALLDRIGTSLYKNAVIPVALAHSYASIPLRTGVKVLTLLAKKLLSTD